MLRRLGLHPGLYGSLPICRARKWETYQCMQATDSQYPNCFLSFLTPSLHIVGQKVRVSLKFHSSISFSASLLFLTTNSYSVRPPQCKSSNTDHVFLIRFLIGWDRWPANHRWYEHCFHSSWKLRNLGSIENMQSWIQLNTPKRTLEALEVRLMSSNMHLLYFKFVVLLSVCGLRCVGEYTAIELSVVKLTVSVPNLRINFNDPSSFKYLDDIQAIN